MKKLLSFGGVLMVLIACNNSTANSEPTPSPTNVQNVNGNVPDTANSVNLNANQPIDSSKVKDSMNH